MKVPNTCECGNWIPTNDAPGSRPGALSRRDNVTEVCDECGLAEALAAYLNHPSTKRRTRDA